MNEGRARSREPRAMNRYCFPLSSDEATDPSRFGPKAANLAALGRAGLRIPDGICLDAAAYRHQVTSLGLDETARGVFGSDDPHQARQHALSMKLGLLDQPIDPVVLEPLLASWRDSSNRTGAFTVVRSSALVEDRFGSSFAGQFESYLGLEGGDPSSLPPSGRAGPRSGPRARCATWPATISIPRTRPWPCSCSRSYTHARQAVD